MERVVKVTVDTLGGVLPKTPQYAGVQGEHNVCRVVFDVAAWAEEPFSYRGEFVGGDGTGGTTAVLAVEDGCVSFPLPAAWTAAGGRAVARLVASVTVDGEERQTVYAVDVPLYFAAKQEYGTAVREEAYTGFTALAEAVQTAVDTVEEKLADGSFIGPRGPKGEPGVSGVYVGSGEMPEGYNVQIDPDGDASPRLTIGRVATLAEGEDATASISGAADAPVLNLGLPRGERGEDAHTAWELLDSVVIREPTDGSAVGAYDLKPSGKYKELFLQAELIIKSASTENKSIQITIGRTGAVINRAKVSAKNGTKLFYRAHGWIGPSGTVLYDVTLSSNEYDGALTRNGGDQLGTTFDYITALRLWTSTTGYSFADGTTIKVWGRVR